MTLPRNPTTQQELQHAQIQLAKAQKNKDQRRIQDWSNRVSQVKAGTFNRAQQVPKSYSDKQLGAGINSSLGTGLQNITWADPSATDPAQRQKYADDAYSILTKNFDADYGRQRQELENKLIRSGNAVGSPLYNSQMQLFNRDEADARAAARNQSVMTGADYYNQDYNNRLNAIGANTNTLGAIGGLKGQQIQKDLEKQRLALEKFKATPRGGGPAETPVFNTSFAPGIGGQ